MLSKYLEQVFKVKDNTQYSETKALQIKIVVQKYKKAMQANVSLEYYIEQPSKWKKSHENESFELRALHKHIL